MNQEILNEITKQDYNSIKNRIEKFLVNEVNQSGSKGVIFGLSGGIDSAVIAALCSNVLDEKSVNKVYDLYKKSEHKRVLPKAC